MESQSVITRHNVLRAPLSFAQERLWFLNQLAPGSVAYNIPCAARLIGNLDLPILKASLQEIIRRHSILRTCFEVVDGIPTQVIRPIETLFLPIVDISCISDRFRNQASVELTSEVARRPFDLSSAPLFRGVLLKIEEQCHVLLICFHHIIIDQWSTGVFLAELFKLYDAFLDHRPSPLPEPVIQYCDYSYWERNTFDAEYLDSQLSYWRRKLADPPTLQLPTDRMRPRVQSYSGRSIPFRISNSVTELLKKLGNQQNATLFTTLLTALKVLLHRYSGQSDIVVGTGIANRSRFETEDLIGCFINMIVLRTDLSGDPSFRDALSKVRITCLEALANQDVPFEQLVRDLHLERKPSLSPLFQTMFVYQNAPLPPMRMGGLTLVPITVEKYSAQFDLLLFLWEENEELSGLLEFNTDLFEPSTITRLVGNFQVLLEGAVRTPDLRLSELPILDAVDREKMLVEWNCTEADLSDNCLHQLFENAAASHPDSLAVCCGQEQWTYQELDRRANQLGHFLQERGLQREELIGICLEPCPELLAAYLGVLKAGGAFLPLDPAYPKDRLAFMLRDSKIRLVLTQQRLLQGLPSDVAECACMDTDGSEIFRGQTSPSLSKTQSENLAYVIYTSGSSGTPKSIALSHLGVVNNICDLNRSFGVGPQDRVLLLSSTSFDMSVYETLGILGAGGCCVIPENGSRRDPSRWAELMRAERITVWNSAPSLLSMLLEYCRGRSECWFPDLRLVFLGGDWIPLHFPEAIKALGDRIKVVGLGGATEASIHSTFFIITHSESHWKSIPYGRPMRNQRTYILDSAGNPVPIGVPGELHIGGVGLARGYFGRAAQTAEKFVPDPFAIKPGQRIYKTGDLARYLPDGNIELLGRLDLQIKIRGHRIELGEIESALRRFPLIRDPVVVVRDNGSGEKRLVAYAQLVGPNPPSSGDMRTFLQKTLPSHMIPSCLVLLDEIPTSANGKVNRLALSCNEKFEPKSEETVPRNPLDQRLGEIWAELLGVKHVSCSENFFDLGGHSLLATQLVSRIRDQFRLEVPLLTIFECPTISQMSEVLISLGEVQRVDVLGVAGVMAEVDQLSEAETLAELSTKSGTISTSPEPKINITDLGA
jgi:amino acid adenylation domain-containing protein